MGKPGRKPGDGKGRLGGRKKGVPNKTTAEMREEVRDFVTDNFDKFTKDWKNIASGTKRCEVFLTLMKFVLPALASIAVDMNSDTQEKLSDTLKAMRDGAEEKKDSK